MEDWKLDTDTWTVKYSRLMEEKQDLLDSIIYASNIQQGIYPKKRHFERYGLDAFVMHLPKNHVRGDFYWVATADDKVYFAAGDCTGHGLSGAMLTMLMVSLLNYAVLNKRVATVSEIMAEIDRKFLEIFDSPEVNGFNNDWADMTLCSYHPGTGELVACIAN